MTLPEHFFNKLMCPSCKRDALHEQAEPPRLTCNNCQMRFVINDGVPVLLTDEAETGE
jgi:uncharacterized protein YbaR (Trm112 family)